MLNPARMLPDRTTGATAMMDEMVTRNDAACIEYPRDILAPTGRKMIMCQIALDLKQAGDSA